jgi:predicted ATPase/class 3 adenylate cyclase/Tfp pilus assembly protein PilF
MTLPSGTVTFLFTDVEGSTRLWEEQREQMQRALAGHDALLHEVIEREGGHVFKTVGDAFCAAFADPAGALAAALAAQQALATDGDLATGAGPLRVRMALHTGTAEQRVGDYFGPPLNRVARLLAAGHGAQVLLSAATQELVRDALPGGASLLDLGEHRLKDLIRPEHAFQLTAPDLPADFPPLRTLDRHPHNLPTQPTPLVGREKELREALERLQQERVRLLTLTGPGGIGKTRLSLQLAAEQIESFPDGVFFVNLAPLTDPALLPSAVAQAIGVREEAERPLPETLRAHLQGKRLLLVLDNFEQITPAAPLVAELLGGAAGLKVLVTSRVALRLRGEHDYAVPPLALPDLHQLPPLGRLTQYAAVRLFLERAQAAKADFTVTRENAHAVAEICVRLDGLPLALELAAARIRILPAQAMLARLQSRLKLLTGGARDLPERQQTLRGAIEWSHDLLSEEEKRLLRRLAVFLGGRTLEAIEAVCNAEGDLDVLEGVSSLVDKSLLRQEESAEGEPRFLMLETIHEYALEKLEESAEAKEIGRRHTEFFLALAEEADPQLLGAAQGQWIVRLEAEHDNLRAALSRTMARGEVELAGRLAAALWRFWSARGHLREGRRWYAEVLAAEGLSPRTRAKALLGAGGLAWRQGELTAAEPLLTESLALCRELEDARGIATALNGLGILAAERGELDRAQALYEEALARWREIGDSGQVANLLNSLGSLADRRQEYAGAKSLFRESLALARQAGNAALVSVALLNLGGVARRQGDLPGARMHLRQSLHVARDIGHVQWATYGLAVLAQLLAATGAAERAARFFGAVEARFAAMGSHLQANERPEYDRDLAAARLQLEPALWERLYQEGAAWSLEEAIACALEDDAAG